MGILVTTEDSMCLPLPSNHGVIVTPPYVPFSPPLIPPVGPLPASIPSPLQIPPVPPPNWAHVEIPVTASYMAGRGQHKFTSKCIHRGQKIAVSGHDAGKFLIHAPIPLVPLDLLLPLTIMGSHRKSCMTTSLVKMDGPEVALSLPLPYQICSTWPLPIIPVLTCANSVSVGWAWADLFLGVFNVAVDCAVSYLSGKAGDKLGGGPPTVLGALGFDLKGAVSYAVKGEGKFSVQLGGPAAGVKFEVEVKKDKKTGEVKTTKSAEMNIVGPEGDNTKSWKQNPDGSEEYEYKENRIDGTERKETTKVSKDGKESTEWEESDRHGKTKKGKGALPSDHEKNDFPI